MSELLYGGRPLILNLELATSVGLNEAIVLQQVHYWVLKNQHHRDGFYWTYNTYKEWREQFPFWSERIIRRVIKALEARGILVSDKFSKIEIDSTKWYRIDYDKLAMPSGHNGQTGATIEISSETSIIPPPEIAQALDLLSFLRSLPYWNIEPGDVQWLVDFQTYDYPAFNLEYAKACRDFHNGKHPRRKARRKGIWKNRFRNWMRKKVEFEIEYKKSYSDNFGVRMLQAVPSSDELDKNELFKQELLRWLFFAPSSD